MLWSAVKMMTWITVTYVAAKEMEMKSSFKNIRRIVLKQWRTLHEIWGGGVDWQHMTTFCIWNRY